MVARSDRRNVWEGKIFIETQGFCTLAGVGLEDGLAVRALKSTRQLLATKHGIVLQQPAYTKYYIELGEISSYPPGYKENAGIFCHNNPWVMIGEARVGNGDGAYDYYSRNQSFGPRGDQRPASLRALCVRTDDRGTRCFNHGEAKNSWLTGTAAWSHHTITQWILGIRTAYDGLLIAPVVPKAWNGFKVIRKFRGVTYDIRVDRTGAGNNVSLEVDGTSVPGNLVPLPPPGARRTSP